MKTLLPLALVLCCALSEALSQTDQPAIALSEPLVESATVIRKSASGGKKEAVEEASEMRFLLQPKESVTLRIKSKKKSGKIKFLAPYGGTFNRRGGPFGQNRLEAEVFIATAQLSLKALEDFGESGD